jgi:hypothetical protein
MINPLCELTFNSAHRHDFNVWWLNTNENHPYSNEHSCQYNSFIQHSSISHLLISIHLIIIHPSFIQWFSFIQKSPIIHTFFMHHSRRFFSSIIIFSHLNISSTHLSFIIHPYSIHVKWHLPQHLAPTFPHVCWQIK